jgi:nicotinamide mononucleotide transporter
MKFGDAKPWQDGASTMLCVVAMVLMVKAYMEQWVPWNLSNALFLAMWVALFIKGEPHSGPMVIMWAFYLINSIRGWIEWKKMVDKQEAEEASESEVAAE